MKTKTFIRLTCAILIFAMLLTTGMLQVLAVDADKVEWRPIINRFVGEYGAQMADNPRLYAEGMYGGDGFQYIQGAAVGTDGTILMGQDMGSARVSIDFGKTWYTPANLGNTMHQAVSCAIDPADSNIMFIAMNGSAKIPNVGNHEGIYRSNDRGQSWTLVKKITDLTTERFYHANFACYPTTGGSPETRIWRFVSSSDNSDNGHIYTSTDGGVTWDDGVTMSDTTYGEEKYCLVQDPTTSNTLFMGTILGLFKTTNGGTGWTKMYATSLAGEVHSFWIDPDAPTHYYASVTTTDTAKQGLWYYNSTSWSRKLSGINPNNFAMGAKDANGKRMIYVHNQDGTTPRIRQLDETTWLSSFDINRTDDDAWVQKSLSGQDQNVFLPHPTIPDACISHGNAYWWRSEGSEGYTWDVSSANFQGPAYHGMSFDPDD
ncbi:MAG: hypothetical protein BWY15_00752 [Firmicutes bacterium ADurb.Bin193]|nr:MAG: hypothetical protein BWY15_00752 [Firmicutes bacterium ADurb.Bin193]